MLVYDFEGSTIRFIGDSPVASDIARTLGYKQPIKAILTKVSQTNKKIVEVSSPYGKQKVTILTEAGIYELLKESGNADIVTKLQSWLFEDILPKLKSRQLYTTYEEAVEIADAIRYIQDTLYDMPDIARGLIEHSLRSLPLSASFCKNNPTDSKDKYKSKLREAKEIAEDMGYTVKAPDRLDLFLYAEFRWFARVEKKIVKGTIVAIHCYPDISEVRNRIKLYFEA